MDGLRRAMYLSSMTALRKQLMSVDEFIPWAERQSGQWELFDGIAVAMSPERVVHGEVKYRIARALDSAIADREGWAVCFFLKTKGKKRGYVERIEQTGADGGDLTIKIKYEDTPHA